MTIVENRTITGGVDTHLEVHVAAALDAIGGLLGVESFPTTAAGYGALAEWLASFGTVVQVGIEGTGSWRRTGPLPRRGGCDGDRGQPG